MYDPVLSNMLLIADEFQCTASMAHAIMDKMEDTKSQLTMLIERGLFESTYYASATV